MIPASLPGSNIGRDYHLLADRPPRRGDWCCNTALPMIRAVATVLAAAGGIFAMSYFAQPNLSGPSLIGIDLSIGLIAACQLANQGDRLRDAFCCPREVPAQDQEPEAVEMV